MKTKFTPGPWFVTGSGLGRYVDANVRAGVLQEVAWCGATEVSEQMEANARLIAAAPELLAALKTAAEVIGHPDDSFSVYMARLIAKATGEA